LKKKGYTQYLGYATSKSHALKKLMKVNAATSGLMVLGLSEAPTEIPIITE
jgi:hypothetical protein